MRMGIVLLISSLLCTASAQMGARTEVEREFLNFGWPVKYRNFALDPYQPYPVFGRDVARYDRLGHYLLNGRVSISVDEQRPGLSRVDGVPFAAYYELGAAFKYSVVRDSYMGTSYSLAVLFANPDLNQGMLAEGLQTRFSPLTLNITRYAGVRFDVSGPKNKATFIYTRGCGDRRKFSYLTMGRNERSPVILWGGHWQSTIGGAIRLGTTFVNQHISDATSRRGSVVHGDLSYDMLPPKEITVRIVDDSPDDPSSPAVAYKVSVLLEGTYEGGRRAVLTGDPELTGEGVELEPSLSPFASGRWTGGRYEAVGDERIEFRFITSIPGFRPRGATFVAVVGGDYRIQVRQVHEHHYTDKAGKRRVKLHRWPSKPSAVRYEFAYLSGTHSLRYPMDFKFPEEDPAYTVVRADGAPRDLSPKVVKFRYGMPTAQSIASVDVDLDFAGLKLDGEFAMNYQDFKFPVREGRRTSKFVPAYFLTASWEAPFLPTRFRPVLGWEAFNIPPDYSGNYDARRGGAVFFTGVPVSPPNTDITQEFYLFDDNDDGDQWPDEHPSDTGLSEINDAGVFPGLDENGDNVPDTDQNRNSVPDWQEPFLFYWSDPPEFIYDVDWNNNDLPDLTENDDEPDYPYRRGERGFHFFLDLPHFLPLVDKLAVGHYRTKMTADGGESRATYLRFSLRYRREGLGGVDLMGDVKRVEDSIPDPSYIWKVTDDIWANQNVVQQLEPKTYKLLDLVPPDPDPMLMRNSTVVTLYLDARLSPSEGLEVRLRNQVKVNRQHPADFPDGTSQARSTLVRLCLSNRVGYTRKLMERLSISAKVKHLYRLDEGYPEGIRWYTLGTVLEGVLKLTDRTGFHMGQEGLPFLPVVHRSSSDGDFDRWTTVAFLRTDTDYWGWKLTTELGVQFKTLRIGGRTVKERTFFVEAYFGY